METFPEKEGRLGFFAIYEFDKSKFDVNDVYFESIQHEITLQPTKEITLNN